MFNRNINGAIFLAGFALFCSIANLMAVSMAVRNDSDRSIMIEIIPTDPEGAKKFLSSGFYLTAGVYLDVMQPKTEKPVGILLGYPLYKVTAWDPKDHHVLLEAYIPGLFDEIKRLRVVGEGRSVKLQVGWKNAIAAQKGQEILAKELQILASQQIVPENNIYQRLIKDFPQWALDIKKLGIRYADALNKFYSLLSFEKEPSKAYEVLNNFFSNALEDPLRVGISNTQIARLLALGAIALYNTELYNVGHVSFQSIRMRDQVLIFPDKEFSTPESDPRLYKIHLMPREQNLITFFDSVVKFILNDPELYKRIKIIKVLSNDDPVLKLAKAPRIILYICSDKEGEEGMRDSKEKAQYVLDHIYAQYKNVSGSELEPEFNEKITDLIYVAQGNRDDKRAGITSKDIFDENKIYFKPGYQGSTVDFRLRNPAHQ